MNTNSNPIQSTNPETIEPSILDSILPASKTPALLSGPMVGECIDDRHPVLLGRYLVRYADAESGVVDRWLPGLHGLAIRQHDRVLLLQPANWPEPLITGVIDGFAHRPEAATQSAANLALKTDEVIRVESDRGLPLVEVRQGATGPIVRLLSEDVQLDLPGKLAISANSLDFQAKLGAVRIKAHEDVIVDGENIKLNG